MGLSARFSALVLVSVLMVSAVASPARAAEQSDSAIGQKWALVVGVSKFQNPEINLRYADKDANDFSQFLTDQVGFEKDHVKVLTNENATLKSLLSNLGSTWLPHMAEPNDLVVIFISTHGSPGEADNNKANYNYLLTYDSEPENLFATAMDMQDLVDIISKRINSDRIILILDACHSGALATGDKLAGGKGLTRKGLDASNVRLGKGKVIFLSSMPNERSWELKDKPNSVFTRCLIETLNKSGNSTTLSDMFRSLKMSVYNTAMYERGVPQTPVMKSTWDGREPLVALSPDSSGATKVAALPPPDVKPPTQPADSPPATASQAAPTPARPTPAAAQTPAANPMPAIGKAGTAISIPKAGRRLPATASVKPARATVAPPMPSRVPPVPAETPQPQPPSTPVASAPIGTGSFGASSSSTTLLASRPAEVPTFDKMAKSSAVVPAYKTDLGSILDKKSGGGGYVPGGPLPPNIAVIPFTGPTVINVAPSQNVVWGKISNKSELVNLAPKLSSRLFDELRAQYKARTLGPRMVNMAVNDDMHLPAADKIDTSGWTPDKWKRIAATAQAKYLITGTIDEADWATSFTSNKYDVKVTARLISGDTGQVLQTVQGLKVHKAPWQGDLGGGRKYFEKEVMQEASEQLVKQFKSSLKVDD